MYLRRKLSQSTLTALSIFRMDFRIINVILTLSMRTYTYMYTYICVHGHIYIHVSLALSIHIHFFACSICAQLSFRCLPLSEFNKFLLSTYYQHYLCKKSPYSDTFRPSKFVMNILYIKIWSFDFKILLFSG